MNLHRLYERPLEWLADRLVVKYSDKYADLGAELHDAQNGIDALRRDLEDAEHWREQAVEEAHKALDLADRREKQVNDIRQLLGRHYMSATTELNQLLNDNAKI